MPGDDTPLIKRIYLDEFNVICGASFGEFKNFFDQPRRGDNRRTAVELKTVLFINVSASAEFVAFLDDCYLVTLCLETTRRL